MAALSRYCRCIRDLFLAFSHKYLHTDSTDFLGSQAGCVPRDRQAKDRESTEYPLLMKISEVLEYSPYLLWTCVIFSGEASTNCRDQYILPLFFKTWWLMISCELSWQRLHFLDGITAGFPVFSAFCCSTACLVISTYSSGVLGKPRSHWPAWKLRH